MNLLFGHRHQLLLFAILKGAVIAEQENGFGVVSLKSFVRILQSRAS
jgi:hypothetical protein